MGSNPPLRTPPSPLDNVTSILVTTSVGTTSPSDPGTTEKQKKNKKKKKAKRLKGDQPGEQACES